MATNSVCATLNLYIRKYKFLCFRYGPKVSVKICCALNYRGDFTTLPISEYKFKNEDYRKIFKDDIALCQFRLKREITKKIENYNKSVTKITTKFHQKKKEIEKIELPSLEKLPSPEFIPAEVKRGILSKRPDIKPYEKQKTVEYFPEEIPQPKILYRTTTHLDNGMPL